MLGYVKIDRGELKVREYEIYCGYYCGVCKSIGKRYGQLPRMALSYDAAFLAIMLASLEDEPDEPVQEHCIGHHVKKKTIIRGKAIDYAADVMLILAWHKLLDDAHDENKVFAKVTATLLKGIYKKLHAVHPALCEGIEKHLRKLAALEEEKCAQLDPAAEAFAKIMEIIFAEGAHIILGETNATDYADATIDSVSNTTPPRDPADFSNLASANRHRTANCADYAKTFADNAPASAKNTSQAKASTIDSAGGIPDAEAKKQDTFLTIDETLPDISPQKALAKIGYHMGKWIYLADAIDDIEENIQSGAYNPLLFRFSYNAENETPQAFRTRIEKDLKFNLYHYLAMVSNYMNSLDIKKNQGIIENIIYFGLNRKTEEIITQIEPKERI